MDKKIINHVLSISDINLRYNWPDLIKKEFPTLNTKQASHLFAIPALALALSFSRFVSELFS